MESGMECIDMHRASSFTASAPFKSSKILPLLASGPKPRISFRNRTLFKRESDVLKD
jgi:hypothetical protein